MKEISICISEGHKTTANILKRKAFTVSMAEVGQVVACDYVGIVSGNKVTDKFARAGFHATRSEFVDAPLIDELSVAVECKLKDYNPETCILRGEIVNVSVDERVLDENGKVDASKVAPIIFDPFKMCIRDSGVIGTGNMRGLCLILNGRISGVTVRKSVRPNASKTGNYTMAN